MSSTLQFYIVVLICQSLYSLYYVLYRRKNKFFKETSFNVACFKYVLAVTLLNCASHYLHHFALQNYFTFVAISCSVWEAFLILFYFILFFCLLIYFPQNSWFLFHFYIHSFFNNLTAYFREIHSFMWF